MVSKVQAEHIFVSVWSSYLQATLTRGPSCSLFPNKTRIRLLGYWYKLSRDCGTNRSMGEVPCHLLIFPPMIANISDAARLPFEFLHVQFSCWNCTIWCTREIYVDLITWTVFPLCIKQWRSDAAGLLAPLQSAIQKQNVVGWPKCCYFLLKPLNCDIFIGEIVKSYKIVSQCKKSDLIIGSSLHIWCW